MATTIDRGFYSNDPKILQRRLGRRAVDFDRTGKILQANELGMLYDNRHRIKPNKPELKLILASMLHEEMPELKTRQNELGWFWFRHCTRQQLTDLLVELAQSKNQSVASPAIDLLEYVVTQKNVAAVLKAIAKHAPVKTLIALFLANFPASVTLPKMREMASNTSGADNARRLAVAAIGRFKQAEDLPLLRGLAADASSAVRMALIEALAAYQQPDDAAVIRKLARDRDKQVRRLAIENIGRYGQPEDRRWLQEVVQDTKSSRRSAAVLALAEFKNPEDLPLFRKLTCDGDFAIRWKAASALGMLQHPDDIELLKKLTLKQCAGPLDALFAYPPKMVAKAIRELAAEQDDCLRTNLAILLGDWCHLDAAKILRRLARAEDYGIRAAAAASLGAQGNAQDLPLLRRMSRWDTEMVRREAVWAVAKFNQNEDIAFLKERSQDEAPSVRTVATMALTQRLARNDLERSLKANHGLRFEPLVELDFALYAPRWVKQAKPRIGDEAIALGLGMVRQHRPEW
jgi:HEAT repeat protein